MNTPRTVEFLFIDRATCGRCTETEANLQTAVGRVRAHGVTVDVHSVHVTNAGQAAIHRMVSSPTIRVDGHDIATSLIESTCEPGGCACSDGTPIDCRLWEWDGALHTAPPVAMLERAITAPPAGAANEPVGYTLPENLARYFADPARPAGGCCPPEARESCCDPEEKQSCCGPDGSTCGCD